MKVLLSEEEVENVILLLKHLPSEQVNQMVGRLERSSKSTHRTDGYASTAKEIYEKEGAIEIDAGAAVSLGTDSGAYVQAWVWVHDSDVAAYRKKVKTRENQTTKTKV
jgi:hypothetical protein